LEPPFGSVPSVALALLSHLTAFVLLMNELSEGCQDAESSQHAVDQQPESFYYDASFYDELAIPTTEESYFLAYPSWIRPLHDIAKLKLKYNG